MATHLDETATRVMPRDPVLAPDPVVVTGEELERTIGAYRFKKPKKARRRLLNAVKAICKELGKRRKLPHPPEQTEA